MLNNIFFRTILLLLVFAFLSNHIACQGSFIEGPTQSCELAGIGSTSSYSFSVTNWTLTNFSVSGGVIVSASPISVVLSSGISIVNPALLPTISPTEAKWSAGGVSSQSTTGNVTVMWTTIGAREVRLRTNVVNIEGTNPNSSKPNKVHKSTDHQSISYEPQIFHTISGTNAPCKYGILSNVYEVTNSGTAANNGTWSISPLNSGAYFTGTNGPNTILRFNASVQIGSVFVLTYSWSNECGIDQFRNKYVAVSNCNGGFLVSGDDGNNTESIINEPKIISQEVSGIPQHSLGKEQSALEEMKVYPNPVISGSELTLEIPMTFIDANIRLYRSSGEFVKEWKQSASLMLLDNLNLEEGTYIILIDGHIQIVKQVVFIK